MAFLATRWSTELISKLQKLQPRATQETASYSPGHPRMTAPIASERSESQFGQRSAMQAKDGRSGPLLKYYVIEGGLAG